VELEVPEASPVPQSIVSQVIPVSQVELPGQQVLKVESELSTIDSLCLLVQRNNRLLLIGDFANKNAKSADLLTAVCRSFTEFLELELLSQSLRKIDLEHLTRDSQVLFGFVVNGGHMARVEGVDGPLGRIDVPVCPEVSKLFPRIVSHMGRI